MQLILCRAFICSISLKLAVVFAAVIICCNPLHAQAYDRITIPVTVDHRSISASRLLEEIRVQTGYTFSYAPDELGKVMLSNVRANRMAMGAFLKELTRTGLQFERSGMMIAVRYKKPKTKAVKTVPASVQQDSVITGTVSDAEGNLLPGVTIRVKGREQWALTDPQGKFTVRAGSDDVLVYSYVGYSPKEETVGSRTTINTILRAATSVLNQVVVVGYGSQKKVNLTGSVATISSKSIENRPVTNVSSSLAGLAAGVYVRQGSGQPGQDGATIRIRGTGTLSNADALVLVDGIIGSLDAVNPNDIASISILKDAAAAAIYGAQAANGVILITTRKGKNLKPQVNYAGLLSTTRPSNMPELVSDYVRHMELYNESARNIGQTGPYQQSTINDWKAANADPDALNEHGIPNYVAYANTNWGREIFENNILKNHHINIIGDGERVNYNVSARILDNPGIMHNTGLKRYELRANIESKVTSFLTLGTQTFASLENQDKGDVGSLFNYLRQTTPGLYPYYNGRFGGPSAPDESPTMNNLLVYLHSRGGRNQISRFNSTVYGNLEIIKGLTLESKVNYQMRMQEETGFLIPIDRWNFATNSIVTASMMPANLGTNQSINKNYRLTFDNVLRYSLTKGKHEINALIGHNEYYYNYYDFSASKQGLIDETITNIGSATNMISIDGQEYDRAMRSFFGRVNYVFNSKYLFEANLRRDGSSRFGSGHRWGNFPSFSAGWRIIEEPFMKSLKSTIQQLKIRGSWGKLGNDAAGNYDWQATYGGVNYSFGGNLITGLRQGRIANEVLRWEGTEISGIALEMEVLNSRLSLEAEYYNRLTDGILTDPPIYLTNGKVSAPTINAAGVLNRGVELNLGWRDRIGSVSYQVAGNFSFNHNEVTKYKGKLKEGWTEVNGVPVYQSNLSDVSSGSTNRIVEDHGINEYYLMSLYKGSGKHFHADGSVDINGGPSGGMIRTPEDLAWVNGMKAAGHTFAPVNNVGKGQLYYGDYIFADQNGDGTYGNSYDRHFTGTNAQPKYTFGLSIGVAYKGFDLSMLWSGAAGMQYYWNELGYNNSRLISGNGIAERIANDHYYYNEDDPHDPANNIYARFPRLKFGAEEINNAPNDSWLYDAAYVKLRNLQVGYTFPQSILSRIKVRSLKLFFSGENLLIFSPFPGLDPEIGSDVGYPTMKQYALGINLGF